MENSLCECGCGREVNKNNRYIKGHYFKNKTFSEIHRQRLSNSHKDKTLSKEHKKNIGKAGLGIKKPKQSISIKGTKNPFYKKTHTIEQKKKWSIERKGYKRKKESIEKHKNTILRENNPNWKGGISCEPYCEQWLDKDYKESIKERDGYICLNPECNKKSNRLCVHHINYVKKNCHPLNLITICISCNGKANKDRNWHMYWYKAIIDQRYGGRI